MIFSDANTEKMQKSVFNKNVETNEKDLSNCQISKSR